MFLNSLFKFVNFESFQASEILCLNKFINFHNLMNFLIEFLFSSYDLQKGIFQTFVEFFKRVRRSLLIFIIIIEVLRRSF